MSYWNDSNDDYIRNSFDVTQKEMLRRQRIARKEEERLKLKRLNDQRKVAGLPPVTQGLNESPINPPQKTWRDYVDITHKGDDYSYTKFLSIVGYSVPAPAICHQEYLSSRALLSPDPDTVLAELSLKERIELENDFKKRIPMYFQLLLQDPEFDSIYNRMSSDGKWIFIDKNSNRQIIIKDETHSFIDHCLAHYAYVFDGFMPFDRNQFFYFLRNKLYAELSSVDAIHEIQQLSQKSFWYYLTHPYSPLQTLFIILALFSSFFDLLKWGFRKIFNSVPPPYGD